MSYLNDPREMAIRPESGVTLEEDNRYEPMYHWGAHILDLCGLPVEEYMKPMTVNVGGGGGEGGGSDTGSTNPSYTLKFVLDGTTKKTYSLEEGAPIPEVSGEKEGYDFSGWKDASGNTPTTMPAANLTLYGVNTIKKFTVKFSVDGEELSEYEQEVEWGKKVTNFPASAKTGYTFSGWEPAIPATIKQNYTFVGTFTKKSYTVTFKVSGAQQTATVEYGDAIEYPAADSKEGYVICGWTPYYETMPDVQNLVFNAVLSAIPYTVSFYIDPGNGADLEVVTAHTLTIGQTIPTVAVPVQSGYSFTNWSADTQVANNKMPASNVNFYSVKSVNNYTLKYFIDGAQDGETETYAYGANVTPRAKYEKEGYTVTDWVFDHELLDGIGGKAMPYYNVEARCTTSINSYHLVIKHGNEVILSGNVEYNASLAGLIPEGYSYTGSTTAMPASDLELSVDINSYDVTVNIAGQQPVVLTLEYKSDIESAVLDYIENNLANELVGHHVETNIPQGATVPAHNVSYNVSLVPNQHQATINQTSGTTVITLNYGDNLLEALEGKAVVDEFHYLDGWTMNGQPIGANDTMPDENVTIVPVIKVKESEVTPVVSGDTATGSTTYDYGTPISEVIEDIIASATPETQADLEDPGYEVEWTVNGSAYTPDMVVREDEVTVEVTITPKPFKLSFMRRATGAIPADVVESGETLYKDEIVYPSTPSEITLSGVTYEFKWDDGSVEEGTPMPSHDVAIYGEYVEKPTVNNVYLGYMMLSDLQKSQQEIQAILPLSATSYLIAEVPYPYVYQTYADPEGWEEFEGEDEEWEELNEYALIFAVPEGKAVTSLKYGDPSLSPEFAGSLQTVGNVVVNGNTYVLKMFRRPGQFYIAETPKTGALYITIE